MKYLDKDKILANIKLMLDIKQDDYDKKIEFLINLIVDEIAIYINHTNIDKLPKRLENIVCDIVIKYLKINNIGIEHIAVLDTKSIKRGDTTIEYNTSNILNLMLGLGYLEQEVRLLKHFKKVKMR